MIQIFALAEGAKKDKDRLKTLEKNIDTEKAFSVRKYVFHMLETYVTTLCN